ncbi:MAG: glucose-1-phosphate adenylyltransferase subunit GlgD [Oscillospiraceae bacterium]|nr:glucose-1-phosphate adenylyltransferase subunit GlgD [Oscillospiraceae bacterium]
MRNNNVLGLIFPNMHDKELRDLTGIRALGSVPFGGRYRLIDFVLSNMVNAGITKVGIITKSHYQSLMDHIGSGKSWDLSRKNEGLFFLPPLGVDDEQYNGRVASLMDVRPFLFNSREEYVVMSDCHVVGSIDYDELVEEHVKRGADITVCYREGTSPQWQDNMCLKMDKNGRITDIVVDGGAPGGTMWSDGATRRHDVKKSGGAACRANGIGLYIAGKEILLRLIEDAYSRGQMQFERDILMKQTKNLRMFGAPVKAMTMVIADLPSYFDAHQQLLQKPVRDALFGVWPVYTKVRDCAPAMYGLQAEVGNSLLADGVRIDGRVQNSIVFRDVQVEEGAVVENCILMQGTVVSRHARMSAVIADKNVVIREGRTLAGCDTYPVFIGKDSVV